jgi:hypothetical protein
MNENQDFVHVHRPDLDLSGVLSRRRWIEWKCNSPGDRVSAAGRTL